MVVCPDAAALASVISSAFVGELGSVFGDLQEVEVAISRLLSAHCTCLNMLSHFGV
jgi:hypothetical protein